MNSNKLISIVTATFNANAHAREAVDNMRAVLTAQAEWIIADGGSTDGTLDVLRDSSDVVATLITGPDRGIFDAWNKGLEACAGRWILFLGIDDRLAPGWLEALASEESSCDLVYGDLILRKSGRAGFEASARYSEPSVALRRLSSKMSFPHPGMAHNRRLFDCATFDPSLRVVGDWEFLLRARPLTARRLEIPQALHELGGVSSSAAGVLKQVDEIRLLEQAGMVCLGNVERLKWWLKMQLARAPSLFDAMQSSYVKFGR